MTFKLNKVPPKINFDNPNILKQLIKSHRSLAKLSGYASTLPNPNVLINATIINESIESSAIENIITTHDELYKAMSSTSINNINTKEVLNYREALWYGYEEIIKKDILTVNLICKIQSIVESSSAGIRSTPGTVLKNDLTDEVVYTPPQNKDSIVDYLGNLEQFINEKSEIDDLVKMAIIHYQFEAIHPFYDGNGRTGRIINVLYLVMNSLINSPYLYMSKYINKNRSHYYKLLNEVTLNNNWDEWITFMLIGVEESADDSLELIKHINHEIESFSNELKEKLPKIYSKELVGLLFYEFYTKIHYIEEGLGVSRKTASTYLNELEKHNFISSEKIGKERIFINHRFLNIVKQSTQK